MLCLFLVIRQTEMDDTGYETTANLLIYSCIILALNQEIQQTALEEVDAVYALLRQDLDEADELSYPVHYPKFRYLTCLMVKAPSCSSHAPADTAVTSMKCCEYSPSH